MTEPAEFSVTADQLEFRTKTNGDEVRMRGMHMGPEAAANLARLVNLDMELQIEIKVKT